MTRCGKQTYLFLSVIPCSIRSRYYRAARKPGSSFTAGHFRKPLHRFSVFFGGKQVLVNLFCLDGDAAGPEEAKGIALAVAEVDYVTAKRQQQ